MGRYLHERPRRPAPRFGIMPALFPPSSNIALGVALVALVTAPAVAIAGLMVYVRTPYNTDQYVRVDQPVEFDHRHHVSDDGINCLYCHPGAEKSDFAGVPATEVCMGCHSQIFNESPLLEPVRRSFFSGAPLVWNRVNNVPDFTYFSHAVHVARGVGCVHCHGRVDRMARVDKVASLTMGFCLDCHRDPGRFPDTDERGRELPYDPLIGRPALVNVGPSTAHVVTRLTTCSACHR